MQWLVLTSAVLCLNAALREELNAVNRYELYSQKAAAEGFRNVAKLFHAAAVSEFIQSENHKAALAALGRRPGPVTLTQPAMGTTSENLRSAMSLESGLRLMLRDDAAAQTGEGAADVVAESFVLARDAGLEHEKLFWSASRRPNDSRPLDYYVSRVSGRLRITPVGSRAPRPRSYTDDYFKIQ